MGYMGILVEKPKAIVYLLKGDPKLQTPNPIFYLLKGDYKPNHEPSGLLIKAGFRLMGA